jgi:ion channel
MKSTRYSGVNLLGALGLLFVTAPLLEDLPRGDLIEAVLLTLVMIFAVLAVGGRRRTLIIGMVLVVPALAAKWINHVRPDLLHPVVFLVAYVIFFGFVVAELLRYIVRAPAVDANVLCAGVAGFLMLGLMWALAYLTVARLDAGAFKLPEGPGAGGTMDAFSAFFFSFVTLCTVGYGDITPVSKVARMLAVMEAIIGLFYIGVLISRLVSMYFAGRPVVRKDDAG